MIPCRRESTQFLAATCTEYRMVAILLSFRTTTTPGHAGLNRPGQRIIAPHVSIQAMRCRGASGCLDVLRCVPNTYVANILTDGALECSYVLVAAPAHGIPSACLKTGDCARREPGKKVTPLHYHGSIPGRSWARHHYTCTDRLSNESILLVFSLPTPVEGSQQSPSRRCHFTLLHSHGLPPPRDPNLLTSSPRKRSKRNHISHTDKTGMYRCGCVPAARAPPSLIPCG
ncbi:hypothetical protein B0T13DRAFT_72360 [Neurospora crassa]|nr:hypothetical protein B0T13DRAFT_72360 [Neurospora crassa]